MSVQLPYNKPEKNIDNDALYQCETCKNTDQLDAQEPDNENKPHERVRDEENVENLNENEHDAHELDKLGNDKDTRVVVGRVTVPLDVPNKGLCSSMHQEPKKR